MQVLEKFGKTGYLLSGLIFALLLIVAVACGGSEAPASETTTSTQATTAPAESMAKVTKAADTMAKPSEAMEKMDAEVVEGKVTMMLGGFNAEKFDNVTGGLSKEPRKHFHGHLTSWDLIDGKMEFMPGIATKWELADGGKTIIYTVMEGAKFHNGNEITVDDVLWSLQHAVGPQAVSYGGSVSLNYAKNMKEVVAGPGTRQVSIRSNVQIPEMALYAAENEGGASNGQVLPARAKWLDGCRCGDDVFSQEEEDEYNKNPMGAGPMILLEHVPQTLMAFERFDDFYYQPDNGFPTDKRMKFTHMDMTLVPEESTRAAALAAGEGDIGRVTLETIDQVKAGGGRLVLSPESVMIESHLYGCWLEQFPCHDKRVRQALNYSINREQMRDELFGSEIFEINGWWIITRSTIGYVPELDPHPFDPAKARQLLTEAGYKNPDNPGGKDLGPLRINTYPDPLAPFLVESAQLVADYWKEELGIAAEVQVYDKVGYAKARTDPANFYGQLGWVAQNTRMDGAGITRLFFVRPEKADQTGTNTIVHDDKELYDQTVAALSTHSLPGSDAAFTELYKELWDASYQITTGYINAPWGVGPRILTWVPYPVCEYACALHTITIPK
jgi:ABC-type transport system substrate-binding protein